MQLSQPEFTLFLRNIHIHKPAASFCRQIFLVFVDDLVGYSLWLTSRRRLAPISVISFDWCFVTSELR